MLDDIPLPRDLGRYRLLKELGRGGMGVVYLSEDLRLRRRVALKVLYALVHGAGDLQTQLEREAQTLASLDHPNIVKVHTVEQIESKFIIDMEFIDGPSAAALVQPGGTELDLALHIAHDVLQALAFCHAQGLMHRDIKPNNILLKSDGTALLTDFGLATHYLDNLERVVETSASANILFGTPRYIPPEAWDGAPPHYSWDVYAIGLVLCELLLGHPVIKGTTALSVAKALLLPRHAPIAASVKVSPPLADMIDRMIALDPTQRFANAAEVLAILRETPEFMAIDDTPTLPIPLPKPLSPSKAVLARRKQGGRSLWAGLVVLLLVAALLAYFQLPPDTPIDHTPPADTAESVPPATPPLQLAALSEEHILTPAQIVAASRAPDPASYRVFSAMLLEAGRQRPLSAMLTTAPDGEEMFIAFDDRSLWLLRMQRGAAPAITGDWAQYASAEGGQLAHGTCQGPAQWSGPTNDLLATLELHDLTSNRRSTATLRATPATGNVTDSAFLHRLEEAPAVLPLLYRDLLPRRLEWARAIDGQLPLLPHTRLDLGVPDQQVGVPTIDGRLEEPEWSAADQSALPARPYKSGAFLQIRTTDTEILLGLTIPLSVAKEPCVLILVAPFMEPPLQTTPRYQVRCLSDGALDGAYLEGATSTAWPCTWRTARAQTDLATTIEFSISRTALGWFPAQTPTSRVLRANLLVFADHHDDQNPVLAWGYPIAEELQHGLLLTFKS